MVLEIRHHKWAYSENRVHAPKESRWLKGRPNGIPPGQREKYIFSLYMQKMYGVIELHYQLVSKFGIWSNVELRVGESNGKLFWYGVWFEIARAVEILPIGSRWDKETIRIL